MHKQRRYIWAILALCLLSGYCEATYADGPEFSGTCNAIQWNANPEPDLAGYRLLDNGVQISSVGLVTSQPCAPLQFGVGQHALQLSAYDTSGNESAASTPPVPFVILAQAPWPIPPSVAVGLAGGTTLPYSGSAILTITGSADALTLDRGVPGAGWPAQWPTGSLAQYFTRTPTGWTFSLCLSCYPAAGTYMLTVTATNAAGSTTATLPITIGTVVPPQPAPVRKGLTVMQPDRDHVVITWSEGVGKDCVKVIAPRTGPASMRTITITCTP
mgnify:CR=1 FL=1